MIRSLRHLSAVMLAALVLTALLSSRADAEAAPERGKLTLTVVAADTTKNVTFPPLNRCLRLPAPWTDLAALPMPNAAGMAQIEQLLPGDQVETTMEFDQNHNPTKIISLDNIRRPISTAERLLVWAVVMGLLIFGFQLFSGKWPNVIMIGADNRYSNSKTQMTFWFGAVASAYATFILLRWFEFGGGYFGGVNTPPNLMTLTGLSALTFGGAKVITQQKANAATPSATPKTRAMQPHFADDLINSDTNQPDLGDIQMLLVACAAVTIFLVSAFNAAALLPMEVTTNLPDVDSTLLASFGIGQGAYLVKKAASAPGEG